ncbi:ATP-binding cassette domain-containing protein [Williamsoniiplasma lucivorax]|uniref:Oligopeptide ABC transporter ATP-binding protein n=1 Tax=Williamsoniiplasma lucivorax TaxID=209274 RepID=A0A2S5REM6_9MOLU|nr:ATP-binding cassette domain-containing protein [Williamsoniiplasma lucivorax]PPE05776.1 oligopeptide ABC transporter ATP-binding protein [Williamsoniiplasma lucivorax]
MKTKALNPILEVRDLLIEFGHGRRKVKAVKGVSFDVYKGETFGLVGESGSGKTTVGRAILGIQPISDGTIYFNNQIAHGKPPDLNHLNLKIAHNMKIMKLNQNTTSNRLNDYLQEFKRVYHKYIDSKYYDLKTQQLREYPDGIDRKIAEGVNLKGTKIVSVKKDADLNYVSEAIKDNLKRLLKIIRLQMKTLRFAEEIGQYIEIDASLEKAVIKYQKETHELILQVKDLENNIYHNLEKMQAIRDQVLKGKYKSISKFFSDLGQQLELIVQDHKQISELLDQARTNHHFNLDLSSSGRGRRKHLKTIERRIVSNTAKQKMALVAELEEMKVLLQLPEIQTSIKESKTLTLPNKAKKHDLKQQMQMIFQDPASSLNDRMAVEQIIAEGLENFPHLYKSKEAIETYLQWVNHDKPEAEWIEPEDVQPKAVKKFLILQLLTTVGMLPEHLSRYPHEFSGGQRQRIGIARALVMKPSFIVADEPISALDVSIRAQVMNLLAKFQKEFELTYVFIAHDLSVVRFVSSRIAVIYRGDIVELAEADELFANPLHPYTKSLLSAIPLPNPEQEKKKIHFKYDPATEHADYIVDFPQWAEVANGHYVYANERELKKYKSICKNK